MRGFDIAYGAVGAEASGVRDHAEEYEAAMQRLRERGSGVLSWGDTSMVDAFAGIYAECTRLGLEALTGISSEISGTGEGVRAVVRNGRDAEAAGTESLHKAFRQAWV